MIACVARFANAYAFSFLVIWSSELYPTTVRSAGLGWVFGIGLIGAIVAPFLIQLSKDLGIPPLVTLGVIGIVGTSMCFFLKETLNEKLKDEIFELRKSTILAGQRTKSMD